jgi:phage-related holin
MIFLAGTELKSIFENIEKAGYPMPQHLYKQLKDLVSKK